MLAALTGFMTLVSVAGTVLLGVLDLPDHRVLAQYRPPLTTHIYAADGSLIHEYYTENRVFVPLAEMPPTLVQAFVSAEDRNFRSHDGVDPVGLARAMVVNVENAVRGRRFHGGSTITQQVAKNLLLDDSPTLGRKIREMALALLIERDFTKDQILEIYLNQIYLGRGAYGVGAAAQRYFGRSPGELTLAQLALLAGMPRGPNNYHPVRHSEAALARRNYVLDRMLEDGAITPEQAAAARSEPLGVRPEAAPETVDAPYFVEEIRRNLQRQYGSEGLYRGGLAVRTTLDPRLQRFAQEALRDGLIAYDRRHGWRGPVANMARIVASQREREQAEAAQAAAPAPAPAQAPTPAAEPDAVPPGEGGGLIGTLTGLGHRLPIPGLPGGPEAAEEAPAAAPPPDPRPLWQIALTEMPRPRGAGSWHLAVALEVQRTGATIGLADGSRARIPLTELAWARRSLPHQQLGYAVGNASAVLSVGDVVLVEPVEGAPESNGLPVYGLRQIPNVQGAIVAIDPRNGAVLAMAGGYSYEMSEFNRATQAQRQPGSAFKPFVYLAALQHGYTPASMLYDVPVEVTQGGHAPRWRPENYNRAFRGVAPLRVGVERSINVMTVRLVEEMGIEPVRDVANAFGIYDDMPLLPAMALGAGETTLLRLTNAYAMIANGGLRVTPHLMTTVRDRSGQIVARGPEPREPQERVSDPIATYQMISILQGVVQRGTAARLSALGRTLAGKTGTTNDVHDAWFVGFSPDLAAGVYVGFDEPRTLGPGEAGATAAVPIFGDFMRQALADRPDQPFTPPAGGNVVWVDQASGYRAQAGSGHAIAEVFRPGTEPGVAPPATAFGETAERALGGTGGLY